MNFNESAQNLPLFYMFFGLKHEKKEIVSGKGKKHVVVSKQFLLFFIEFPKFTLLKENDIS